MNHYTIGLDVGGTKIQAGLVATSNKVLATEQFIVAGHTRRAVLGTIMKGVAHFYSPRVRAIGLGITGLVNRKSGVVVMSPNLPADWRNVPLAKILRKKFKVPISIDNDAHCIALAEALVGEGKNYQVILSLTLGTGIGAGLVINKQLYRGNLNAVEFGHLTIAERSPRCSCGRYGHFEALVSGPAMEKLYCQATRQKKNSFEIEQLALVGHRPAKNVLSAMSRYLAIGLANAVHAYNPDIIVLGGGLARATLLVRPAVRLMKQHLLYPSLKRTRVVVSRLGYRAGVIGAALLTKIK